MEFEGQEEFLEQLEEVLTKLKDCHVRYEQRGLIVLTKIGILGAFVSIFDTSSEIRCS